MSTVVVLGTGGTIAGTADPDAAAGYGAGRVDAAALVAGAPVPAGVAIEAETVARLDSKDMDGATWARLARRAAHHAARADVRGVVVTHGTDTLEETAWLLARTFGPVGKPVVLTGSMRPADAADADGPRNLGDAIAAAAAAVPARGVVVAFAGGLFAARGVRKAHTTAPDAFDGRRVSAGEPVHETVLLEATSLPEGGWPWVETIASGALADGRAVDALVAAGVEGFVVATTGNGSVHAGLEAALDRAAAAGIAVLRASRVAAGGIEEPNAARARFASAGALSPAQARVELLLRLLAAPRRASPAAPPSTR